ncbi:toxin-antitoxin system, antitoxin component domain protein [Microbacterium sp. HMWF026]|nr:toxin-antitoxin system, antitoxin component domain protein [Microbacterium sp. HMWF026]
MAVIRAAALFETGEFDDLLTETPADVRRALRTLRNTASHSGYRSMDDDLLWLTLTRDLPPHVASWRRAAFD